LTNLTQHWRSLFENKYLGSWNLWSAQKKAYVTATVVIESIAQETVVMQGGRKSLETLIRFRGKHTPLIATKKMARVLVAMFGPAPEDALGKTITLYVERGFKTKDGPADVLRIRNDRAGQAMKDHLRDEEPPAAPETFDEEVGDAQVERE
jgi:hypothetical protein